MEPLPTGWLVRVSRSKRKVYYYHTATGKTQWSRPTAEDTPKRQRVESKDGSAQGEKETSMLHSLVLASMRAGGSSITRGTKRAVVFTPWPHQLEAVEKVIAAIQTQRGTERFLLQHSTGAGKTLTIAALTHQLLYVKDATMLQFHTVVVMLDRVKLNEQVGDAVERYLRQNGVDEVFRAESIEHLAKLLDPSAQNEEERPQRVIITTTHKMGLLVRDDVLLTRLLHRSSKAQRHGDEGGEEEALASNDPYQRVAIITDEAHRSHTSSTRDAIEKVVKAGEGTDAKLTFIGFTATPNAEALELFGSPTGNGFQHPFHCYPISQATSDGRIMNVLADYTCIRCEVETSVFPEPVRELLQTVRGARRRVIDHASDDIAVLKAKALLMMTDFLNVKQSHSKMKCMVVARSRLDVARYYKLITTFVLKKQLGWNCYAAFSGTLTLDDETGGTKSVTEQTLNGRHITLGISDIVIVCDKLDTGYNEPLLACMYVDRYLRSSSHIVQLLSRLNRLHRNKTQVRVLDFANHAAQVRRGFADYWQEAKAPRSTDIADEMAEQLNLATAIVTLCDFFPSLCTSPVNLKNPQAFVIDHVLPLERDSFQQVLDALRGATSSFKKLEMADCTEIFDVTCPFSFELLSQLKKEVESHLVAIEPDVELSLDKIKSKMSARVNHYHKSFSGALHPQALLDRVNGRSNMPDTVSSLVRFGLLEYYEAFLVVGAARNHHKSVNPSITAQLIKAVDEIKTSSALTKASKDGEDRMPVRLVAMREELAAQGQDG